MSVWSFFAGPTLSKQNIRNSLDVYVKVNESQHKQCGQTQHFSTGQKKKKTQNSHQEKSIEGKYCEKINIDTINSKNIFDRSTEHKQCNIP